MAQLKENGDEDPAILELATTLKREAKVAGLCLLHEPVWQGDFQIGPRGKVEYIKLLLSVIGSTKLPVPELQFSAGKGTVSYEQALSLKTEGLTLFKNGDIQVFALEACKLLLYLRQSSVRKFLQQDIGNIVSKRLVILYPTYGAHIICKSLVGRVEWLIDVARAEIETLVFCRVQSTSGCKRFQLLM